jgi:hypothetical protein
MTGSTAHVDLSGGLGNQLFALADLLASGSAICACKRVTPSPNPHSTIDYCATLLPELPTHCDGSSLRRVPVRHRYHDGVRELVTRLRIDRPRLDAAFLHIRGGDYIGHPTHFIPLSAYYERAIRHFAPDTVFYVLTNDRAYAESMTVLTSIRYELVECDEVEGLAWMKRCARGGICSNSTYAWWGAVLDPERTLVLPSRWSNDAAWAAVSDYRFPGAIVEEVGIDAYCIHLPHRTDRMPHIDRIRAQYPSLYVHLVDAIRDDDGHRGCILSHKKAITYAKEQKLPYLLVLEDDCQMLLPEAEFMAAVQDSISYLQSHPTVDIVNGCGNLPTLSATLVDTVRTTRFLTAPAIFTTHCILYSARAYDRFLAISERIPIDIQTNTLSMVFTYPYLATQAPSYSDIKQEDVSYENIERSRAFVKDLLEPPRPRQEVYQPVNPLSVLRIPIRAKRV